MLSMISKYGAWPVLIVIFLSSAAVGAIWRSMTVAAEDTPMTLAELRPPAAVAVEPANRWSSAGEAVAAADAIGVIRVSKVTQVPGSPLPGIDKSVPVFTGYGKVEAQVLRLAKGELETLKEFSFDAFYRQGEILVSDLMPPLTEDADYLVFVKGGRVMYPGGLYVVRADRAWYIGAWSAQAAGEPPRGAWSGRRVDDVLRDIASLKQAGGRE